MTIEANKNDGSNFAIAGENIVALTPNLHCGNGVEVKFPIEDNILIKSIEMDDWARRPDNDDIGGTVRLVLGGHRMDVVNGDLSHKETWREVDGIVTMFDIKKNGVVEYEVSGYGLKLKEQITFKHTTK